MTFFEREKFSLHYRRPNSWRWGRGSQARLRGRERPTYGGEINLTLPFHRLGERGLPSTKTLGKRKTSTNLLAESSIIHKGRVFRGSRSGGIAKRENRILSERGIRVCLLHGEEKRGGKVFLQQKKISIYSSGPQHVSQAKGLRKTTTSLHCREGKTGLL